MRRFYYTGLSLIELMISLAISSFIILSSIYLLQHTIKSYHRQQQQIRQLENIRYLDYILNRAIHVAGFMGCHALKNTNIHSQLKNNQLLLW